MPTASWELEREEAWRDRGLQVMTFSLFGALASRALLLPPSGVPNLPPCLLSVIFPRIISVFSTPTLWHSLFSGFPCSSCFTPCALPSLSSLSLTQPLPLCPPLLSSLLSNPINKYLLSLSPPFSLSSFLTPSPLDLNSPLSLMPSGQFHSARSQPA